MKTIKVNLDVSLTCPKCLKYNALIQDGIDLNVSVCRDCGHKVVKTKELEEQAEKDMSVPDSKPKQTKKLAKGELAPSISKALQAKDLEIEFARQRAIFDAQYPDKPLETKDITHDYCLVGIHLKGNRLIDKDLAHSDKIGHFQMRLKSMKTKELDGWVILCDNEPIAYKIPKAFRCNSLGEMMDRIANQIV